MKDSYSFDAFDIKKAVGYAASLFAEEKFNEDMKVVLSVAFSDKRNLPTLRFPEGQPIVLKEYIKKWVEAYLKGYNNRPSVRIGNKSNTFPDEIVKVILQSRLPNLSPGLVNQVEGGHSLMMTIENLVGDLLEEYLSLRLNEYGWYCCWGSTVDAVDFCKADGRLLQIKNSDNSENSSSSRVRAGTTIEKWNRRVSTKKDTYKWDDLCNMIGCSVLSEDDFRAFVVQTITNNPGCIYVEPAHPLTV